MPFTIFMFPTGKYETYDHEILLDRLRSVGLSDNVISWFNAYLKVRIQCVQVEGIKSDLMEVG